MTFYTQPDLELRSRDSLAGSVSKRSKPQGNLVANLAEQTQSGSLVTFDRVGILEAPVDTFRLPGKKPASFRSRCCNR